MTGLMKMRLNVLKRETLSHNINISHFLGNNLQHPSLLYLKIDECEMKVDMFFFFLFKTHLFSLFCQSENHKNYIFKTNVGRKSP